MSRLVFGGVLLALATQSGCFLFKDDLEKCREVREYQGSEPAPRLAVPADLEPLPAELRLPVPYGETNKVAVPKGKPCLIEPPDFFDQDPV
jgi:uncharacterized lipoprotein